MQSIDDEYWLRRIISPLSIEPFLKEVGDLAISLPENLNLNKDELDAEWSRRALNLEIYHGRFSAFSLINPGLPRELSEELENIADVYAIYMGGLLQALNTGNDADVPDIEYARMEINNAMVRLLTSVRKHQQGVGGETYMQKCKKLLAQRWSKIKG